MASTQKVALSKERIEPASFDASSLGGSEDAQPPPAQPGERRKRTLAVGGVACAAHLWVIHGKYYDLEPFVPQHPGGYEMITLGRGRDCTEMFESIHCLSHRAIHKLLAKYEVPVRICCFLFFVFLLIFSIKSETPL